MAMLKKLVVPANVLPCHNLVPTVLRLEEYGGQEEGSWVTLEVEAGEQDQ